MDILNRKAVEDSVLPHCGCNEDTVQMFEISVVWIEQRCEFFTSITAVAANLCQGYSKQCQEQEGCQYLLLGSYLG